MYPRHAHDTKHQARIEKDASRTGRREFLRAGLALGLFAGMGHLPHESAASTKDEVLSRYAERLFFHEENRNELRIQALQARDRRGVIPNNNRPPQKRVPEFSLPVNPEAREGAIRKVNIEGTEKACALTFDMCELATTTTGFDADIVLWLQDNNVPATFFVGGKWMRSHERRVREILQDPLFELGNHAWAHGNFALLTPARMKEEILDTQCQYEILRDKALKDRKRFRVGNDFPLPEVLRYFRFPYGRSSEAALNLLADLGLEPIQWDVVAETGGNNASISQARHVVGSVKPGSILLFHANLVPRGSFQLLRYVAEGLRRQGYRFVSVGELLAMGKAVREKEGYFVTPGDNAALDERFGAEGTGR